MSLQLFVKTMTGRVITLDCESSDSILSLKQKIAGLEGEAHQLIPSPTPFRTLSPSFLPLYHSLTSKYSQTTVLRNVL